MKLKTPGRWIFSLGLFLLLFLSGCASMRSGRYVKMESGQSLKSLAETLGLKEDDLKQANQFRTLNPGDWVFIPLRVGFINPFIEDLIEGSSFDPKALYAGRFLWPVPASTKISSRFGKRRGRHHDGIDIPAPRGTAILAADDGAVIYSGNGLSGYGNLTLVKHEGGLVSVYAHAKKNLTRKGQKVSRGEMIAKVGSTGRSSAPHLHFEVRQGKRPLNPYPYIQRSRKEFIAQSEHKSY